MSKIGKIIIKIKPNGEIMTETKGIKGKKCKDYLDIMSKFLDAKIVDSTYTKKHYETENINKNINQDVLEDEKITLGKK